MERFLLQLMISKGIGDVTLKKILHHSIANPECTLKAICETPEHFSPIFGFKPATIESHCRIESLRRRGVHRFYAEAVRLVRQHL